MPRKKSGKSSSDSDDSADDLRWEQDATRFIKAEDAMVVGHEVTARRIFRPPKRRDDVTCRVPSSSVATCGSDFPSAAQPEERIYLQSS